VERESSVELNWCCATTKSRATKSEHKTAESDGMKKFRKNFSDPVQQHGRRCDDEDANANLGDDGEVDDVEHSAQVFVASKAEESRLAE